MGPIAPAEILAPPAVFDGTDRFVRVGSDPGLLAFHRATPVGSGLFVQRGGEPQQLAALRRQVPLQLALSPDARHLAVVLRNELPVAHGCEVVCYRLDGSADPRRHRGVGFAWHPEGDKLVVADPVGETLALVSLDGRARALAPLEDDGALDLPPAIAVAPDGQRIAFTQRSSLAKKTTAVLVERSGSDVTHRVLTEVPGERVAVLPSWSPHGRSLALHVVHFDQGRSAAVLLRHLTGDGEVLASRNTIDVPTPAAFRPDGHHLYFFSGAPELPAISRFTPIPQQLVSVEIETARSRRHHHRMPVGHLRFVDAETLIVEGRGASCRQRLGSSPEGSSSPEG